MIRRGGIGGERLELQVVTQTTGLAGGRSRRARRAVWDHGLQESSRRHEEVTHQTNFERFQTGEGGTHLLQHLIHFRLMGK